MADLPSKEQIRGARGLLGWSMLDLAKAAALSVATIRRLETQPPGRTETATGAIKRAFEGAGIQFLDDGEGMGVRLRP